MGVRFLLAVCMYMQQDRFLSLLAKKMSGAATTEELAELEHLLKEREDWREMAGLLTAPREKGPTEEEQTDAEALFAAHATAMQLSGRFNQQPAIIKPFYTRYRKALAIAAVFILTASTYFIYNKWRITKSNDDFSEVVTRKGNKSNIRLQDGTQVMMNSDTRIVYGSDFGASSREVKLTGEAFFDVTHNASKPFIIHTGNINIRVLGTAFNVKSYPQDGIVETSLIRGRIEVTFNDRPNEKIILRPGEKLLVKDKLNNTSSIDHKTTPSIELNKINVLEDSVVAETAWMKNKIIFSDDRFEHIAQMLERKFDMVFEITDKTISNDTYTGIYENEDLYTILRHMSLSKPFQFKINGNKVTIYNNQTHQPER